MSNIFIENCYFIIQIDIQTVYSSMGERKSVYE